jgi:3-methyladenine DNA glycosylase AlkD
VTDLVAAIRDALAVGGDPAKAIQQQAYMKSELPYRGFTKPELTALLRPVLTLHPPQDRASWEADVRELWDGVTHREEWYAALAVARDRRARAWPDRGSVPLFRHLLVTGAWWDVVDETAQHLVGPALLAHREAMTVVLDAWAVDADPWVRRTAVICQVGHRADTDRELLRRAIDANVDDRSFWLRKGIGWALRDYARTDPEWVLAEVDRHGDRLSGLSRREALKHLVGGR